MILFAAIKMPHGIAKALAQEQKGVSGAKWSAAEKLHLTLGYFGEVDDEHAEMLDDTLAHKLFPSFDVTLKGAGHFGELEPHAIWAGVEENPNLIRLHDHCRSSARKVGIQMKKRKFRPHVTLAYMKPHSPIDRIVAFEKRLNDWSVGPFLVDEFFLFSSHRKARGPNLYRIEASYPLLG